jgi:hypothetical protein
MYLPLYGFYVDLPDDGLNAAETFNIHVRVTNELNPSCLRLNKCGLFMELYVYRFWPHKLEVI